MLGTLSEATSGGSFTLDTEAQAWLDRVAQLQHEEFSVPATISAELRSYQLDGFRWLSRLAALGLGACLADDMGLGKTIEILALLASRIAEGPILVVAPTSVCANWISEAARFAPSLRVAEYAGAERSHLLALLGAGAPDPDAPAGASPEIDAPAGASPEIDAPAPGTPEPEAPRRAAPSPDAPHLVVCSYGLLQQDVDELEAIEWGTGVLDEAQFIKNAESQRARAAIPPQGGLPHRRHRHAGGKPPGRSVEHLPLHQPGPARDPGAASTRASLKPIERAADRHVRQSAAGA